MGRQVRTNGDKWEVFSTVVDEVVATFDSKQEVAKWFAQEGLYKAKLDAIQTIMTFPNQWFVDGEYQTGNNSKFYSWRDKLYNKDTYEEYYKMIDDKFNELMGGEN